MRKQLEIRIIKKYMKILEYKDCITNVVLIIKCTKSGSCGINHVDK